MAIDARATTFVTGAAGFIGTELVKALTARGHQVFGLTRFREEAERVRRAGGIPVMGDLLESGKWQDEVAADWAFHLPPHSLLGPRMTRRRAASVARARLVMDAHVLDAVSAGVTRRIVYVADTSYYGATGAVSNHRRRTSSTCGLGTLPRTCPRSPRRVPDRRAADRHGVPRVGLWRRFMVSQGCDRADSHGASRPAIWQDRTVGVPHPRQGLS